MSTAEILSLLSIAGIIVLGISYVGFAILLEWGDCSDRGEGDLDDLDLEEHYNDFEESQV